PAAPCTGEPAIVRTGVELPRHTAFPSRPRRRGVFPGRRTSRPNSPGGVDIPMSFEVGVVAHFSAEHHLVGDFGPASTPHSHDYRVVVSVTGDSVRGDGTLFDITKLQNALTAVIADLDDQNLNEISDLTKSNPTA